MFAIVVWYAILRTVFYFATRFDLDLDHLDVDTAFLNPTLKEPNYMKIPEYLYLLPPCIKNKENKLHLKLKVAAWRKIGMIECLSNAHDRV